MPSASLVAELVPQLLPLLLAQVIDTLHALRRQLGSSILLAKIAQKATSWRRCRSAAGHRRTRRRRAPRVLGGDRLDCVDVLTAGVEAVPDGALGVFVGEPVPIVSRTAGEA